MRTRLLLLITLLLVSIPTFAQRSFDMRYNEAVEYYTSKKYDKAIQLLEAAKKSPGVTKEQTAKAGRLIKQCQAAKSKLSDLNLSKETIYSSGMGQKDSIYVTAGKSWEVSSHPSWCNTWVDSDVLYIEVLPNDEREPKKGIIEVTMGKERTAYILVSQEKKSDVKCPTRIHTVPERAIIYIDSNPGMLTEDFVLGEGSHSIRIEKSGFERKDTVIVVGPNDVDGKVFDIMLKPNFATISVDIRPADGYTFDGFPSLNISGNEINLHPNIIKSFNVDQELSYYSVYEDNVIPLHPGQYMIKAYAEGFVPETRSMVAERGVTKSMSFTLNPICGTLTVEDEEDAAGARVIVDGKDIGAIPLISQTLKSGKHTLRLEKEGYTSGCNEYEIDIQENKDTALKISMHRYSEYSVVSDPAYCKVYLNGEYMGTTPVNLILTEGQHSMRFEKAGYMPQERSFTTDLGQISHQVDIHLIESYPFVVMCDKDSLNIKVTQGKGKNCAVYADNVKTPAVLNLPLSNAPYHLELSRLDGKKAFRGNFSFKNEKRNNKINVLSWTDGPALLSGNWYLVKPDPILGEYKTGTEFQRIADASFLKFKIFPGMSTSTAKCSVFWGMESAEGATPSDIADCVDGMMMIPAVSAVFINEEFRIGGAVTSFADVNLLATYAWYPNLSQFLSFAHMSGHDIFVGGEFGSRIKVLNVNIRAGIQAFYGQANIPYKQKVNDQYFNLPCSDPIQNMRFVVSAGFTLGGPGSRGQNILRVF